MEHPYHNTVPITDYTIMQNDFALLELTGQIDMTATPFANSACLPSMAPVLLTDKVSKRPQVRKTSINNFIYNHFRPLSVAGADISLETRRTIHKHQTSFNMYLHNFF